MKKAIWIVLSVCFIVIPSSYAIIQTDFRSRQIDRNVGIICSCLIMLPALSLIVKEFIDWRKGAGLYQARKLIGGGTE